jgi:hypothetical protein
MGFMPERTIASMLDGIFAHDFVLPAIQREFVWSASQTCRLFDSLLRGYPIGNFLTWRVPAQKTTEYVFYDFMHDYHQKDHPHCALLQPPANQPVVAVLDGQQRLTALNIGLRGSYAQKLPRLWWNNPNAYPVKYLYLDLASHGAEDELGMQYDFRFLTPSEAGSPNAKDDAVWFRVRDIMGMVETYDLMDYLSAQGLGNVKQVGRTLGALHKIVHVEKVIHYYEENSQDIDKVLNIFIRVNSGGTVLSYSDLLLSVATAQWKELDARKAIIDLVDDLNNTGMGFDIGKDLVLKTGLMLLGKGDIRFNIKNFDRDTMQQLEASWQRLSQVLRTAVALLADFGFSRETLTARSVIIPVAYYLHVRDLGQEYPVKDMYGKDRHLVRQWVIKSLLKRGVWGSGLDGLLVALRGVLKQHGSDGWPTEQLDEQLARRGKSLRFEDAELEDLLGLEYGDRRVFSVLALLYPGIDTTRQFHVDHIFPRSRFTRSQLIKAGVPSEDVSAFVEACDRIANLQLLPGPVNVEKRALLPRDWLDKHFSEPEQRNQWLLTYDIPSLPNSLAGFMKFADARRERMGRRLAQLLGSVPGRTSREDIVAGEPADAIDEEAEMI